MRCPFRFFKKADLLLTNLKEVIDKLQKQNKFFQIKVKELKVEKEQLVILNKNLLDKVDFLEENVKQKFVWLKLTYYCTNLNSH